MREPPAPRGPALIGAIAVALTLLVILAVLDGPLRTDAAGSGTISFELAGDPDEAEEIVSSWKAEGEEPRAAFGLGLDFLFAPLYALAIAGACLAAGERWRRTGRARLAGAAIPIAWLALAAAVFDWSENVALAVSLLDEPASPWPQLAFAFALPKFAFTDLGILYALIGGIAALLQRPRQLP